MVDPQGLKPASFVAGLGTAEAVPSPKTLALSKMSGRNFQFEEFRHLANREISPKALPLMPEMANSGEHHGQPEPVGCFDHLLIAD